MITPIVPSAPISRWRRSGPAAARTALPSVTSSPFGSTASIEWDAVAGTANYKVYRRAEDESTCIVFGMPKEAIKLGGVDRIVPLDQIPSEIISSLEVSSSAWLPTTWSGPAIKSRPVNE